MHRWPGFPAAAGVLAALTLAMCAHAAQRETAPGSSRSAANAVAAPMELQAFIHAGETLIAYHHADLNGDGRKDYLLVVEHARKRRGSDDEGLRTARVIARTPDGSLAMRAASDKAVLCRTCGGMMGDPFVGIEIGKTGFAVRHYGGSSWRWSADFRFAYSRRDDSWQLVGVREESLHVSAPDKLEVRNYRPPKDFGKIDFTVFDPERFQGQGEK